MNLGLCVSTGSHRLCIGWTKSSSNFTFIQMSLDVDSFSSTLSLSQLLYPLIKHICTREGDSNRFKIHKVQLARGGLVRGGPVRLFVTRFITRNAMSGRPSRMFSLTFSLVIIDPILKVALLPNDFITLLSLLCTTGAQAMMT